MSSIDLRHEDECALARCAWLRRYPIRHETKGAAYGAAKRLLDVSLAAVALVLVLPLLVLAVLAIKCESPRGPAFFVQVRAGARGRPFRLLKLRTMVPDASTRKDELLHLNTRAWPDFKVEHDPRVLKVGRVLRAASIDELPQLVNVLVGTMTLVGPRPTSLDAEAFQDWQRERFSVKPGMTGVWQVTDRDDPSLACKARLDIAYALRRGLRLDAVVLLKTFPAVFRARGAY